MINYYEDESKEERKQKKAYDRGVFVIQFIACVLGLITVLAFANARSSKKTINNTPSTTMESTEESNELVVGNNATENNSLTENDDFNKVIEYDELLKTRLIKYKNKNGDINHMVISVNDYWNWLPFLTPPFHNVYIVNSITSEEICSFSEGYGPGEGKNLDELKELAFNAYEKKIGKIISNEEFINYLVLEYGPQNNYTHYQIITLIEKLNIEEKNKQAQKSTITAQASIASNYSDDDEATLTTGNLDNSANPTLTKNNK